MNKKLHLSILYVFLLSLLLGGAILYSKTADKSVYSRFQAYEKRQIESTAESSEISLKKYSNEIVKNQAIKVNNNDAGTNLKVNLLEYDNGQILLKLDYILGGKRTVKSLKAADLPEIRSIFSLREKHGEGYRVNNIYLNKYVSKVYFSIQGRKKLGYTNTTHYSYGLSNFKLSKLFYDSGEFSDFSISPEGKYNAFTCVNTDKVSKLVIIRCRDDCIVQNGPLRDNSDLFSYDYEFIKWSSNEVCRLLEKSTAKDGSERTWVRTIQYHVANRQIST